MELRDYKYKEICALRGENVKTGKSKQLQIEDWKRFFTWENPTTQIYRVTEVFDTPKEKVNTWGGARKGAGAKAKVQEEFDYLINAFFCQWFSRYMYNVTANWTEIYFNNSEISKYFGLYDSDFFSALNDEKVDGYVFKRAYEKLIEKRRSWIFDKIKKMEDINYREGIVAYKDSKTFDYRDDLLGDWNTYQSMYLSNKHFSSIKNVIDNELWDEMIGYITGCICNMRCVSYKKIEKCHRVSINISNLKLFDLDDIETYRVQFNQKVVDELKSFFSKEENVSDYIYLIDKYIKIKE